MAKSMWTPKFVSKHLAIHKSSVIFPAFILVYADALLRKKSSQYF